MKYIIFLCSFIFAVISTPIFAEGYPTLSVGAFGSACNAPCVSNTSNRLEIAAGYGWERDNLYIRGEVSIPNRLRAFAGVRSGDLKIGLGIGQHKFSGSVEIPSGFNTKYHDEPIETVPLFEVQYKNVFLIYGKGDYNVTGTYSNITGTPPTLNTSMDFSYSIKEEFFVLGFRKEF